MKRMWLLILLVAVLVCPSAVFAAGGNFTTTLSYQTFFATITATGGIQWYDASLRNRTGNGLATKMTWTGIGVGNTGYKVSDQYLLIVTTVTNVVNWRMNIYTDNLTVASGFHPYYTQNDVAMANQNTAVSTAAVKSFGLVGQGNNTGTGFANGTCYGLALAWMVLDVSSATPVTPVFSANRSNGTAGFTNFMWKFVLDKGRKNINGSSAWDPTSTYVRVCDPNGFYWNEDPTKASVGDGTVFVYLAVDSTGVKAQSYSTKSLTVDAIAF